METTGTYAGGAAGRGAKISIWIPQAGSTNSIKNVDGSHKDVNVGAELTKHVELKRNKTIAHKQASATSYH